MATYAELKTRIVTEMVRSDLETTLATQLATHIARACEYFADERFWFNAAIATVNTTAGVQSVNVPASMRRVDRVSIPAYDTNLAEVILTALDDEDTQAIPSEYAYYNNQLYFTPIPDAVYSLRLVGLAQIDAPVNDNDQNVWTTEAQDLIVARAKMTLYRDQFRDPEGAQMALGATQEALDRLKRETARRLETPLRPVGWGTSGFNWKTGD